jgi:predicted ATPase
MIQEIQIENYKSIQKLKLNLGRITVLIGENGSGKSNILEAIALASAAANGKLEHEFLFARGIRVTEAQFMRSAFDKESTNQEIKIYLEGKNKNVTFGCVIQNDNKPYSNWLVNENESSKLQVTNHDLNVLMNQITREIMVLYREDKEQYIDLENYKPLIQAVLKERESKIKQKNIQELGVDEFLIYSPELPALKNFEKEGQIQPLGVNGEGLIKLLKVLSLDEDSKKIIEIKEKMRLIYWFQDFNFSDSLYKNENKIQIRDKYLDPNLAYFDQKSSNEGFLFLLFYFSLFISDNTPKFFAIDNIDASLNPKLCSQLMKELVELSKKYNKQVVLTTHNPAILDGLNLDDEEQQLLVIYRNKFGYTKARYIDKPEPLEGQEPVKLSEAFLRGYIGGIPKNF